MRPDDKGEGGRALPAKTGNRMVGLSPDGVPVNNVTKKNESDVSERKPWLYVMIWDEDLKNPMFPCYIPNTRRMPDIIILGGIPYEAWDTTKNPPQYRKCMVAQAITTVEKDMIDGKTQHVASGSSPSDPESIHSAPRRDGQ